MRSPLLPFLALFGLALSASVAAQPGERVVRTRIVGATFVGWERRGQLWAQFDRRGRPFSAMPGDHPVGVFLEARRDRPLRIWLATVRIPLPLAGTTEIERIVRVHDGRVNAEQWWRRLSERERGDWTRRYHEAIQ